MGAPASSTGRGFFIVSRLAPLKMLKNLFHAGTGPPAALRPLTHFGTKATVMDLGELLVAAKKPHLKDMVVSEGVFRTANPVRMIDSVRAHSNPVALYEDILASGSYDNKDFLGYLKKVQGTHGVETAQQELRQRLLRSGFDSISYTNKHEGIGQTSWVSLVENQFEPFRSTSLLNFVRDLGRPWERHKFGMR